VSERQRTKYELEEQLSQSTQCWQPMSPRLPRQCELSVHIEQRIQKCERIRRSESLQNVDQLQELQRSHCTHESLPRSRPTLPLSSRKRDSKTRALSSSLIGVAAVSEGIEKHIRLPIAATGPTLLGLCLAFLLVACNSSTAPAPARTPSSSGQQPAPEARALLRDADWGVFGSRRFSLAVAVPMRSVWQKSETVDWFVLRHQASESELLLRTWRASRLTRVQDCEAQARTLLPALPLLDETNAVEQTRIDTPSGYVTELGVAVEAAERGRFRGYVLVFGAAVGHCFAGVFSTLADGEVELSERLELVAHGVFSRVRVGTVEDRVPEP